MILAGVTRWVRLVPSFSPSFLPFLSFEISSAGFGFQGPVSIIPHEIQKDEYSYELGEV